jgi:hypothetical protein
MQVEETTIPAVKILIPKNHGDERGFFSRRGLALLASRFCNCGRSQGNPQFPRPTSNDGAGNVVWDSGDIAAFVSLWNAAKASGWQIYPAATPTLDFAAMAAAPPGPYYWPQGGDPLFDS